MCGYIINTMVDDITVELSDEDGFPVVTGHYKTDEISITVSEWGYPLHVSISESLRSWSAQNIADGILLVYKMCLTTALDHQKAN